MSSITPQELSAADVRSHTSKDDLYLIINSKVYDVSSFANDHPGGLEILLEVAGQDATEAYHDAHHSAEANEILQGLEVGILKSGKTSEHITVPPVVHQGLPTGKTIGGVLKPDVFQEFELQRKTLVSHNVAIYRFKLPYHEAALGLPVGQHISVGAQITRPDGASKEVVRSYTPISGDHEPGYFDLLVKTYPQGNISKHIASLVIGQTIRVQGPKGAFIYRPNMAARLGMIAGGTGITPMLQIIHAIRRGRVTGDTTQVDLIFGNVNFEDILLKEELDCLAKTDSGIRVYYVLNDRPDQWEGGVGFITASMISKWLPKPAMDVKILLCGPPPMISGMKTITESLGFERAHPVSRLEDQVFAF